MTNAIERAVWEWLLACPALRDLSLAAGRVGTGSALLTAVEDTVTCRYLKGRERQLRFTIVPFDAAVQSPNDDANLAPFETARAVGAWIEARDAEGDLPELPVGSIVTGATVEGITATDHPDGRFGKVSIRILIDYYEEDRYGAA